MAVMGKCGVFLEEGGRETGGALLVAQSLVFFFLVNPLLGWWLFSKARRENGPKPCFIQCRIFSLALSSLILPGHYRFKLAA